MVDLYSSGNNNASDGVQLQHGALNQNMKLNTRAPRADLFDFRWSLTLLQTSRSTSRRNPRRCTCTPSRACAGRGSRRSSDGCRGLTTVDDSSTHAHEETGTMYKVVRRGKSNLEDKIERVGALIYLAVSVFWFDELSG